MFKLTISDEQGIKDTDTVSIFVHPDPLLLNLVQLTLPLNISTLTHTTLETIIQKLTLIMGDVKIHLRDIFEDTRSTAATITFYVEEKRKHSRIPLISSGLDVERYLKKSLKRDGLILGSMFLDVRTVICQNECSDHGICNSDTRTCICEPFWMQSFGGIWSFNDANCGRYQFTDFD